MLLRLWHSGEVCIAVAAFLFSVSSLFVKLTSNELSVLEVCALSSSGCALLLFSTTYSANSKQAPSPHGPSTHTTVKTAALIALRATLGAVTILSYYAAVELGDIRDATALFFTSPLFTLLFECLLHSKLPSRHHLASAAVTAAGALMISRGFLCLFIHSGSLCPMGPTPGAYAAQDSTLGRHEDAGFTANGAWAEVPAPARTLLQHAFAPQLTDARGPQLSSALDGVGLGGADPSSGVEMSMPAVALALLAAATNSAAFLTIQAIGQTVPALSLTFWHHAATATAAAGSQLALMLWFWLQNHVAASAALPPGGSYAPTAPPGFFLPGVRDSLLVAGVMAAQLLAQVLLNRGFSLTSPTRGAAINVLQVVFSFVWDSAVFGKRLQGTSIAGGLLICCGVLIQALAVARKQRRLRLLHEQHQAMGWEDGESEDEEGMALKPGSMHPGPEGDQLSLILVSDGLLQPLLTRSSVDQARSGRRSSEITALLSGASRPYSGRRNSSQAETGSS